MKWESWLCLGQNSFEGRAIVDSEWPKGFRELPSSGKLLVPAKIKAQSKVSTRGTKESED